MLLTTGNIVIDKVQPSRKWQVTVISHRFYKALAMNMNNDHKSVYAAAAEVVGMTLALLADRETSAFEVEWREQYVDGVVKQLMDKKPDRLITCLHGIQLHFPTVADRLSYSDVRSYSDLQSCAGSGVERICPLGFLAGCLLYPNPIQYISYYSPFLLKMPLNTNPSANELRWFTVLIVQL